MSTVIKKNIAKIEKAYTLFSSGKQSHALDICNNILKKFPNDVNALNLTAIINDHLGNKEAALSYFKKAANLSPKNIDILTNTGITFFELGKFEEAKKYLSEAINIDSSAINALFNLGNVAFKLLDFNDALKYYNKTISLQPNHFYALNNIANIYLEKADYDKAEIYFKKAISVSPEFLEALIGLTSTYLKSQKIDKARLSAQEALRCYPDHWKILSILGTIEQKFNNKENAEKYYTHAINTNPENNFLKIDLAKLYVNANQFSQAKVLLEDILTRDPNNALAHYYFGTVLAETSDNPLVALKYLKKSFEIDPTKAEVAANIGKINIKLGNFVEAKQYLELSLSLNPDNADILNSLGVVYQELKEFNVALEIYKKSLKINNATSSTLNNIGNLYIELQDAEKALSYLNRALDVNPKSQSARNNLSLLQLLIRDYKNGWKNYRHRNSVIQNEAQLSPDKLPNNIKGKKILVIKDQGIGDELFFLRFMPQFRSKGVKIDYLPSKKLIPVLNSVDIVDNILKNMPNKSEYFMCLSVGDLPYLLDHQDDSQNPAPLTLNVNDSAVKTVENILKEFGPPPYIGLTWRAGGIVNNSRTGSYLKEIDLDSLCKSIENLPGTIIAIQKNALHSEFDYISKQLNRPVLDTSIYHDDLEKILALLKLIDVYITVSNTNVHLREGLNKTSHVFVCSPPEWRWQENVTVSSWFPNSIIYRQSPDGSWANAISTLQKNLSSH